jgi:hypothetical protein
MAFCLRFFLWCECAWRWEAAVSWQRLCSCPLDCQSAFDGELAVSGRTVTSPP